MKSMNKEQRVVHESLVAARESLDGCQLATTPTTRFVLRMADRLLKEVIETHAYVCELESAGK